MLLSGQLLHGPGLCLCSKKDTKYKGLCLCSKKEYKMDEK